jgi:hypothetical protein
VVAETEDNQTERGDGEQRVWDSKIRKDGSYGVPLVFIGVLAVKLTN